MKKMLPPFSCYWLFIAMFLLFSSQVSAEDIRYSGNNCAVLIDVPDDLCPEDAAMTPLITCPQNIYVSCLNYTGNPSDYGQPVVNGYWQGVQIVEHTPQYYNNNCGIGYIIRTWTIYTPVGTFSCTQTINITGGGSFGYYDIHWPLDYVVTNQCYANPHPDDLPPPYNKPTWNNRACSMIGISYKDDIFYFGDPYGSAGCRKILRTWKVIDWCQYVPNNNNNQGLWMKTQVIKLEDKRAPQFVNCPSDFVVSLGNTCSGVYVDFPRPFATDNCNQNPRITNNSPYSTLKGSDASGFYPLGTTSVRFLADDGCGNFDTCVVRVTVRDLKKPTAICYHGLSASLMQMGNDGFIRLTGKIFDAGSYDNCTPRSQLRFDLVPNEFTCENRGRNDVIVIVTDESGNTDFCLTYVIIQDNMGMCPPDTTGGIISGLIHFHNNDVIEDVMLYVKNDDPTPAYTTDDAGIYILSKLVEDKAYNIRPVKPGSLNEGLTTLDVIMLRQHINGEKPFDNPYKIIAADINFDNKVNIQDLNQLKLILMAGIEAFPGIRPWRFVDKAFVFTDPMDPFADDFTEVYNIAKHNKTDMKLDFIGLKIGDFDGTCMVKPEVGDTVIYTGNSSRSTSHAIVLHDQMFNTGQQVTVNLNPNKNWDISGAQFSIRFDNDVLKFENIAIEQGSTFKNLLYSVVDHEDGIIYFSWDNEAMTTVDQNDLICKLTFSAVSTSALSDAIQLISAPLNPEVYDMNLISNPLSLQFEGSNQVEKGVLTMVDVFPNPFSSSCTISFNAEDNGVEYNLSIRDVTGKIVSQTQNLTLKGRNNITIDQSEFRGSGVYFITLESGSNRINRKVILVD
jgi:hypothetical protein